LIAGCTDKTDNDLDSLESSIAKQIVMVLAQNSPESIAVETLQTKSTKTEAIRARGISSDEYHVQATLRYLEPTFQVIGRERTEDGWRFLVKRASEPGAKINIEGVASVHTGRDTRRVRFKPKKVEGNLKPGLLKSHFNGHEVVVAKQPDGALAKLGRDLKEMMGERIKVDLVVGAKEQASKPQKSIH